MCRIKKSIGLVLAAVGIVFAQSAPQWQNLYPQYNGLTFGDGTFVAVSGDGLIRSTGDGTGWKQSFIKDGGNARQIYAVAYGAGRFVALQKGPTYLQSENGTSWSINSIDNMLWRYVVFGETDGGWTFVAVDDEGMVGIYDGTAWDVDDGGVNSLSHAAFGGGRFVIVGDGIKSSGSSEIIWKSTNISSSTKVSVVAFGDNKFVALSKDGANAYTSTDGLSWTTVSANAVPAGMTDMVFGSGKFVAVGASGKGCWSSDGSSWTGFTLDEADNFKAVKYGNNTFLALGAKGSVYKSADGSSWARLAGNSVATYKHIASGGGKFVAVGDSGVSVSIDGKDWVRKLGGKNLTGVAFGEAGFAVVGNDGAIFSSADGNEWEDHSVENTAFTSIAFGRGTFVAGGRTGAGTAIDPYRVAVYSSADGKNWSEMDDGSNAWVSGQYPVSLCFGNDKFIATVNGTKTMKVCDATGTSIGKFWSSVSTLPAEADGYYLGSAVYAVDKFVVVGTKPTGEALILNSADATAWGTSISVPQEMKVKSATYAKDTYIAVADSGNIYAYLNNSWIPQGKATNRNLSTIYSNGNIILATGANGAMLYSEAPPTSVKYSLAPRSAASYKGGVMRLNRVGRASAVTLGFTPKSAGTIAVYSLNGRQLYKARLGVGDRSVNLPERAMSSGSVIVRYSGDGRVVSQRFQFVR